MIIFSDNYGEEMKTRSRDPDESIEGIHIETDEFDEKEFVNDSIDKRVDNVGYFCIGRL